MVLQPVAVDVLDTNVLVQEQPRQSADDFMFHNLFRAIFLLMFHRKQSELDAYPDDEYNRRQRDAHRRRRGASFETHELVVDHHQESFECGGDDQPRDDELHAVRDVQNAIQVAALKNMGIFL